MARGAEGKLRRRNQKKADKDAAMNALMEGDPTADFTLMEEIENMPTTTSSSTKLSRKKKAKNDFGDYDDGLKIESEPKEPHIVKKRKGMGTGQKEGIKTGPLILLVMMVGTTALSGLVLAFGYASDYMQKHNVMGNISYRLGIAPTPKKRLLSFYDKHSPEKIPEMDAILSKYYGSYPKLVKKLERKYGDYGYFVGWEEDERAFNIALEQLGETREYLLERWNMHAPRPLKTAARNINYNVGTLVKKGKKIFKKHVWPTLEMFVGVPKGAEKQKRQDAAEARKRKAAARGNKQAGTRRRNTEFRDDFEEESTGDD